MDILDLPLVTYLLATVGLFLKIIWWCIIIEVVLSWLMLVGVQIII
jgi:hypothetical protein